MQFVNNSRTRPKPRPRPKSYDHSLLGNVLRWKLLRFLILLIFVFVIFYGIFVFTGPTNGKDIQGHNRYLPDEAISFVHGDHMDVIHIEHRGGHVGNQAKLPPQAPGFAPQKQEQFAAGGKGLPQSDNLAQNQPPNAPVHAVPKQDNQPPPINVLNQQQNFPQKNFQQQPPNVPAVLLDNTGTGEFPYHIIQSLTNTDKRPHLKTRFEECMISILDKSSINLHFFFVVDKPSRQAVMSIMQDITNKRVAISKFQVIFFY